MFTPKNNENIPQQQSNQKTADTEFSQEQSGTYSKSFNPQLNIIGSTNNSNKNSFADCSALLTKSQRDSFAGDAVNMQAVSNVQRKFSLSKKANSENTSAVHSAAARGVSGTGHRLPHFNSIQKAFGKHDISHVQAYTSNQAQIANQTIKSEAYAVGNKIAFAERNPSLHTAAHEAAHVIQQRAGVHLKSGVGEIGDKYEQQADAVADVVVQGKSAENLLPYSSPQIESIQNVASFSSADNIVQRKMGMEFETYIPVESKGGKKFAYQEVIFVSKSKRWKIIVDDDNMEFVTEPMRNEGEVASVITEISNFVQAMKGHFIRNWNNKSLKEFCDENHVEYTSINENAIINIDSVKLESLKESKDSKESEAILRNRVFNATPQMTLGVSLDKLSTIMSAANSFSILSGDDSSAVLLEDQMMLTANNDVIDPITAANTAKKELISMGGISENDAASGAGFIALLIRYLNDGAFRANSAVSGAVPYPKAYFPLMARTDFVTIFNNLNKHVRAYITIKKILELWGNTELSVAKKRPVLANSYKNQSGPQITIAEWLESIISNGRLENKSAMREYNAQDDILKKHYNETATSQYLVKLKDKDLLSRGNIAYSSISMGLLDMDKEEKSLALFEFREFPAGPKKALQPERWVNLATSLYNFYDLIQYKNASANQVLQDASWRNISKEKIIEHANISINNLTSIDKDKNQKLMEEKNKLKSEIDDYIKSENTDSAVQKLFANKLFKSISKLYKEFLTMDSSKELKSVDKIDETAQLKEQLTEIQGLLQGNASKKIEQETAEQAFKQAFKQITKFIQSSPAFIVNYDDEIKKLGKKAQATSQLKSDPAKILDESINHIKNYMNDFEKRKASLNLKPDLSVNAKGNCLFESVQVMAPHLHLDQASLRNLAAKQLRKNPLEYIEFLANTESLYNDQKDLSDDIMMQAQSAADFLSKNGNWNNDVGDLAPRLLADAIQHKIIILNMDCTVRAKVGPNNARKPIMIFYNGSDHYMPIKD